jgi:hypothetical protein
MIADVQDFFYAQMQIPFYKSLGSDITGIFGPSDIFRLLQMPQVFPEQG